MKRALIILGFLAFTVASIAQKKDEEKSHKFRQDNIFLGGSIALGLSNGYFDVGGNPEIGYSVAEWLDAGVSFNVNYSSLAPEYNGGFRQRSFNYGGGMFVRLYPIHQLFIQVLPEYNWIKYSAKDISAYGTGQEAKLTKQAPSLLLGAGYTSREIGNTSFYTVIMFDAGNNYDSPYVGSYGTKFPIIRAGFDFYLRPKRK